MKKRNYFRRSGGYTLVEVIVVLVISAILVSLSVLGIAAWQRYASFKKQEEHAQALYLAAQRELTGMLTAGELPELAEKLGSESLMSDVSAYGIANDRYDGRLWYIIYDGTDTTPAGLSEVISRIFGETVMDTEALSAHICIEFDPIDGVVYSVFYSDDAGITELTYNQTYENNTSGSLSMINRDYDYRKERVLGYYSSDLSDAAPSGRRLVMGAVELINDDFLYLKWNMKNVSDEELLRQLTYSFELYGEGESEAPADDKLICTIKTLDALKGLVDCEVSYGETTENLQFECYVEDGSAYMLLDAIDIGSASAVYGDTEIAALSDTLSLARLLGAGLSVTDDIYLNVSASSAGYRTSTKQASNNSSAFFFGKTEEADETILSVSKARHLYNIRFAEAMEAENKITYRQTGDLRWGGTSLRYSSYVLSIIGDTAAALPNADFPMIPSLSEQHAYDGSIAKTGKICVISELSLGLLSDGTENGTLDALGLFGSNFGEIKNLQLKNITAESPSTDYVGAVCAENCGVLSNIVIESGSVSGADFVGGIAGIDGGEKRSELFDENNCPDAYSELVCNAEVSGRNYVGGIVGYAYGDDKKVVISDCESFLRIVPKAAENYCIGGIVGYAGGSRVTLSGCTAASLLSGGERASDAIKSTKGYFIGGIAGINDAKIIDCELINRSYKNREAQSYVIGKNFVGGIAGLNLGSIDGSDNASDVFGERYVGGIVGAHTKAEISKEAAQAEELDPSEVSVSASENASSNLFISNCANTGLCAASDCYSGGIAGYSSANMNAVSTHINASERLLNELKDYDFTADYVGGLIGYNIGRLTGGAPSSVVVYGNDYIGGLIGYNAYTKDDTDNVLGYSLSGGYISGCCFVGGLYGANTATGVLNQDDILHSKPNSVSGNYFAGGTIGACVIASNEIELPIDCSVDNFLGRVSVEHAFAGGYVGYLQMVEDNVEPKDVLDELRLSRDASIATAYERLAAANRFTASDGGCFLVESTEHKNVLQSVSGKYHIGGVIGCCAGGTKMRIAGVLNSANVTASGTVAYNDISASFAPIGFESYIIDDREDNATASTRYSFAGGIIGYAGVNVTIDSCQNAESVTIRLPSEASYTAALVEVNEGTVVDCTVGSVQQPSRSNVGGLVGVNTGSIENCSMTVQVRGRSCVGGIAVRNEGVITNCTVGVESPSNNISCAVYSSGSTAGGIAAVNARGGRIENCEVLGDVNYQNGAVTADYSGGIAGRNYGTISDCTLDSDFIGGADYVGGAAGMNKGEITGFTNNASLRADSYGGGVVGNALSGAIEGCENNGEVISRQGYSGGIAGASYAKISKSENRGAASSLADSSGGIAGISRGEITECANYANVSGYKSVGGIAAENYAALSACTIGGAVKISSPDTKSEHVYLGLIAGINADEIKESIADSGASITTALDGSYIGGIAGENREGGKIIGKTNGSVSHASLSFASGAEAYGNVGGVCGVNLGEISDYRISGQISSTACGSITLGAGLSYGTGGIAGVNGRDSDTLGSITRCAFDGTLTANNISTSTDNSSALGGIAGLNNIDSTIEYSTIGVSAKTTITGSNAFTGGIVGYNCGEVRKCRASKDDNITSDDLSGVPLSGAAVAIALSEAPANGYIGGVTATNERVSALVTNCSTGSKWSVTNNSDSSSMTGGVIGLNMSGRNSENLINRASVTSHTSYGGGIIGAIKWDDGNSGVGFVFSDYLNYGRVSAKDSAGGIVGYWQAFAGDFVNCKNYGRLTSTADTNKLGGVIAHIYNHRAEEHFSLYGCTDQSGQNYYIVGYKEIKGADYLLCENKNNIVKKHVSGSSAYTYSTVDQYGYNAYIYNAEVTFNAARGRYVVSWEEYGNRDYIEATIYHNGKAFATRYITPNVKKMHFTLPYEWGGSSEFTVSLRAHGQYGFSASVTAAPSAAKTALPEPTVRFVILQANVSGSSDRGYFLIENADEYSEMLGNGNWYGTVTAQNSRINGSTGRSNLITGAPSGYNTQIFPNSDSFYASPTVLSQFAYHDYLDTSIKNVSLSGAKLLGTSAEELQLNFTMQNRANHGSKVVYRVELFNSDGIYGEAIVNVPANMESINVNMDVVNAEAIAGSNMQLRWYPWEDELNLHYYSFEEFSGYALNGALLDGTRFYSPYLASNGTRLNNYGSTTIRIPNMVNRPNISTSIAMTQSGEYTFSWSGTGNNTCDVVLSAIDSATGLTRTLLSEASSSGRVTVNAGNWSFGEVKLTVTNRGSLSNGVTASLANTASHTFALSTRLTSPLCPNVSIVNKDDLLYRLSDWAAIGADSAEYRYLKEYHILINGEPTPYMTIGRDVSSVELDLSDYRDQTIRITVVAVSNDHNLRTNSEASVAAVLDVSSRIDRPDAENLLLSPHYEDGSAITKDAFSDPGITIRMSSSLDMIGVYEIEAYCAETLKAAPNTGSDAMLLGGGAVMDGTLANAYKNLAVDPRSAGWYVYVRVRAVSDSAISSLWSDWAALRLPKLRLDPINAKLTVYSAAADTLSHQYTVNGALSVLSRIKHSSVSWLADDAADGYQFTLNPRGSISATGSPTLENQNVDFRIVGTGDSAVLESRVGYGSWSNITASARLEQADYPMLSDYSSFDDVFALTDYSWSYRFTDSGGAQNILSLYPLLAIRNTGGETEYCLLLPDCYMLAQEQKLTGSVVISDVLIDKPNMSASPDTVPIW